MGETTVLMKLYYFICAKNPSPFFLISSRLKITL